MLAQVYELEHYHLESYPFDPLKTRLHLHITLWVLGLPSMQYEGDS